jgi:Uma2 family endonuclease
MATASTAKDAVVPADGDEFALKRPLSVNIRPILESVVGKLTDDEIDQWFVGFERANEGRGFYLELTAEGELIINPMVNRGGGRAEFRLLNAIGNWEEEHGGETYGANANMRLPDGSRIRPDALWLSPEQVSALPSVAEDRAITVCPAFVAEIVSGTDTLPPLQRKMERYMANGAQLGWLIDPYRRRVYVYRPGVNVETLEDPETISGDPVLSGFVFEVRQRIFALYETTEE